MSESLKAKTFSNFGYNSVAKAISLVFQAIGNIILTRTLTAGDYGIVGFATIFTTFLGQFSDLGIGSALIHRAELDDNALYTGFTVKFFLGIAVCLVAWGVAPLASKLFDNPAVVDVIRILSLIFVVNSLMFIPNLLLTKELNFKIISIYNTLTILFQSTVAIILALNGFKFWSIVIANVSASVFTVVIINIIKPVKIKFSFNRAIADQLINYGGNIFITGFIVFIIFNIDNFVIGSVAGSNQLGYYALAFNWGIMICTLLNTTILSVMFPTLSKMHGDKERIKNAYLRVLKYISLIGIMVNMTLFVIAKDFLIHVLGHGTGKWLPALVVFRILCVYGIFRMLLEPIGSVLMAVGKTEQIRKANLIVAIVELTCLYPVLMFFGIEGVAVLVTIAYILQYAIYYPFLNKNMNISFDDIFTSVKHSIISITAILAVFILSEAYLRSSLVIMIIKIVMCFVCYILMHGIICKWKIHNEIYTMLVGSRAESC